MVNPAKQSKVSLNNECDPSKERLIHFILKKLKLESTLSLPQVAIMAAIEMVSVSVKQHALSQVQIYLRLSQHISPLSHPQTITLKTNILAV